MDDYGPDLFGLDSSTLRLDDPDTETVPGVTTTRATQALGEVPVLDSTLVFTGRGSSASTDGLRVTGIRGRVFPGLTVSTTPTLTPEQAAATAAQTASGTSTGTARLVVLPTGAGVLAWEVVVVADAPTGPATGYYYIDAQTGDVVDVRPVSADIAPPMPGAAEVYAARSAGRSTKARARDRQPGRGARVEQRPGDRHRPARAPGHGVRPPDRSRASSSPTPPPPPGTRPPAAAGSRPTTPPRSATTSQLPGELWVSQTTTVTDAEAIAAQAYSHDIVEYYEGLGRNSWDDEGGPLISSVHFGPASYCNAMLRRLPDPAADGLRQPVRARTASGRTAPSSSPTSPPTR